MGDIGISKFGLFVPKKIVNFRILLPHIFPTDEIISNSPTFPIRHGSSTSNIVLINVGVPRGGVLSPILFNGYASGLKIPLSLIMPMTMSWYQYTMIQLLSRMICNSI